MDEFLALLIKIVVFGVVLFVLPMIVAKTFLVKSVDKRALGVVMAVLFGLGVLSVTMDLVSLLTRSLDDNNGTMMTRPLDTRMQTNPFNLDIRSR